ncbi:hypothetical protein RHMOL_Rhmol04G0083300 [Rhododendron molle]|uniref:Uncharacterized protein n=1 Tax=Rhododendron molle TaxID=49168 RepID=A0ACC0NYC6_RHOML|nr:hypothetical protein RHMOL_Rhmol04G0083300 [Rhododendron molle]
MRNQTLTPISGDWFLLRQLSGDLELSAHFSGYCTATVPTTKNRRRSSHAQPEVAGSDGRRLETERRGGKGSALKFRFG